jgi:hypothetical protein
MPPVSVFEIRASIVEVETTTLTAPQFDSRVTDITKPSLFSERDDGGRGLRGRGHSIASVRVAKSIVLEKRNGMERESLLRRRRLAKSSDEETENSVLAALEAGCRLIDTAASYGNEIAVGRAIAASGVPREELFVATKLGTSKQGFDTAQESCKESLDRLGLDYLDLYLIH